MSASSPLFQTEALSLPEQVELLKKLIGECQTYQISFGMFKTKSGFTNHNAMVVFKNKFGHNISASYDAENLTDMIGKANELISKSNQIKS